jgi:hypothetical protein
VRKFERDGDFVLAECLRIKPHFLLFVHVSKKHCLVLVRDVFPGGVVLAILAEQVGEVALPVMGTKVQADVLLQFSFLGEDSGYASAFFHMEQAHLEALVGSLSLLFLIPGLFAGLFAFSLVRSGRCFGRFIDSDHGSGGHDNTSVFKEHGARKRRDLLWDSIVLDVIVHFLPKLHGKFDRNDYVADIQLVAGGAVLNKIGVNAVLGEECQVLKKLVDFSHEEHVQMHEQMHIGRIPAGDFFVFDKANHLVRILVEQRLSRCNIDDCQLHSANVATRHGDVFHAVDLANSLDEGQDLLALSFDDGKILLILLFLLFLPCCNNHCLVVLRPVMERVDACQFMHRSQLEIIALKCCIQVTFYKLCWEHVEQHQPVEWAVIVVVLRFNGEDCLDKIC